MKRTFGTSVLCVAGALASMVTAAEPGPLRLLRCDPTDAASLRAWQQRARITLSVLLNMDDQIVANRHDNRGRSPLPLHPKVLETTRAKGFTRSLVEIDSRPDRRIKVVVTVPPDARPSCTPAVVCIHGHGGHRDIVYIPKNNYRGFARVLAEQGYVTLSTNVGQHTVQSPHRTLMGERLWDLIRVVDLATSLPEVDPARIGCAGLSLGGEMAMWLGAMDQRIAATVSSGFLTTMENLRKGHCMCWDFPGLQRRYEFSDIYALIAPRPLQCQNGQKERLPHGFPVSLARQAMAEIRRAYRAAGHEDRVELVVHPDGHVFDVPSAMRF
ncbi:MAG TPA: hypothetical protein EYP14_04850, partial [Planctomycetaceae bacterium]|nr:hypothetical protein [Planctomycetaceae bacterium]